MKLNSLFFLTCCIGLLFFVNPSQASGDVESDMANSQLSLMEVMQSALRDGKSVAEATKAMIEADTSQSSAIIFSAMTIAPHDHNSIIKTAIEAGVPADQVVYSAIIASDGYLADEIISAAIRAAPNERSAIVAAVQAVSRSRATSSAGSSGRTYRTPTMNKIYAPTTSFSIPAHVLFNFDKTEVEQDPAYRNQVTGGWEGSCWDNWDNCPASLRTLGHVSHRLKKALDAAGYDESSFYWFPCDPFPVGDTSQPPRTGCDGVAVVTQIERINRDGTPHKDRWKSGDMLKLIGFKEIVEALESGAAPRGRYRIITFVVTSGAVIPISTSLDAAKARAMLKGGSTKISSELKHVPVTRDHSIEAFVYQYKRGFFGAKVLQDSRLSGREHLEKSGIAQQLPVSDSR